MTKTDAYTVTFNNGKTDLRVEMTLSQLEAKFVRVQQKIADRKSLDLYDRAYLAAFMATMHVRTNPFAEGMQETWSQLDEMVKKMEDVISCGILFYAFDVIILAGRDVTGEPLVHRRELLETRILSKLDDPIRESPILEDSLSDLIDSVRAQGLEGLVAKRRDSRYEAGQRSGAWQKMRINQGQEFVIAGYTPSPKNFDALIFGYYEGDKLMYAARARNGFTPAMREQLFKRFRGLEITTCPFANLPEKKSGRWGQGLTADKMAECRWLRPMLVGQFEFVEWTPDAHLRHSKFIGLREDRHTRDVGRD